MIDRPTPKWWQDYLAGRLTTPQQIYAASVAEHNGPAQDPDRTFFADPLEPPVTFEAPKSLQAPSHFKTNAWLRQCERADWAHVDPRLAVWSAMLIHMALKRGIPLYVHAALRDKATQDAYRKKGTSKVSYPNSAHNIGEAVDIVHGTLHWNLAKQEWKLIHVLGNLALDRLNAALPAARKLVLTWGGDWRFYDPAHWEISDYRSRTAHLPAVQAIHRTPYSILKGRDDLLRGVAIGDPVPRFDA